MQKLRIVVSLPNDNAYQHEQRIVATVTGKRLGLDLEVIHARDDSITQSQQLLEIIQSRSEARPNAFLVEPVTATGLPRVAEAAVVPSPDAIRWNVPKAFITLKPGFQPSDELAREIFKFIRGRLGPYKRIRRIEFSELPKTISGKIRRVQLRGIELESRRGRRPREYWEDDFPDLKDGTR